MFADVEIVVNGVSLKAHKCVLTSRSEKFQVMLLSEATQHMQEQKTSKIIIDRPELTASIYKEMLRWVYTGECTISEKASEVIPLL